MKAYFVTFFSVGTLFSEQTTRPIDSYDIVKAIEMSKDVIQRYNARPYGFCFVTRERGPEDLDSKETHRSGMYYLGGKIETLAEVEARNDPTEEILRSNMRCNGFDRIVTTVNGWKSTQPFQDGDTLLDVAELESLNEGRKTDAEKQ